MDKKKYNFGDSEVVFEKQLLPLGFANRTGNLIEPRYIIIHEVSLGIGKSPKSYDMNHYAEKIFSDGKSGSPIGYHYLVSDNNIFQFIPDNEFTMHSGSIDGNRFGIGIERLICEGINYEKALYNQARVVATLMYKYNIPLENVMTHKHAQEMFGPTVKKYKLAYTGQISNPDKEYLLLYKSLFLQMSDDDKKKYGIVADNYSNYSIQRKIVELYELVNLKLSFEDDKKNFKFDIAGLHFSTSLSLKQCPNRLLVGQRGGLETFYKVVMDIYNNGNFLFDILDDRSISQKHL